ncbi:peptide deformylase [Streptomyces sp. CA-181903]|uniref:peptide deformylase n=1 Tax=Streptomyces sp. CA-181903 TaxID=3240055 RepID=UPI003D8EF58F
MVLREVREVFGLPVVVFCSDVSLAQPCYRGRLILPDVFTRLVLGLFAVNVAPAGFYARGTGACHAHFDALPVDFTARAVTALGDDAREGTGPITWSNERTVGRLFAAMERIARVYPFVRGMGLAAPQVGIGWAVAVVRPADPAAAAIVLHNPRVIARSQEMDEQFEGCLSFFGVRGLVPRPLTITVVTTELDGAEVTTVYERGLARRVRSSCCCTSSPSRQEPLAGSAVPADRFRAAIRAAAFDDDSDIPDLSPDLITRYVTDLRAHRLI